MTWSPPFLDELQHRSRFRVPRYVLEDFDVPGFGNLVGGLRLSSHDEGPYYSAVIASSGHAFSPGSLTIGEWSAVVSSARIALTAKVDFRRRVRRGQILQLRVGYRGWALADYQRVFVGQFQDVSEESGLLFVEIRGLIAGLSTRFNDDTAEPDLFSNYPASTTLAEAYTAGAEPEIELSSTADAEKDSDGGKYLIRITPTTGDPFYVTGTALLTTPDRLDGTAEGLLGTTAVNALNGDTVDWGWHIEDHPIDIARKLLATWDGTNGPYDTLPTTWGIGLPDALLDHNDMDAMKAICAPSSGTAVWNVLGFDIESDPLALLNRILTPAGLFLVERQGKLTVRWGSHTADDSREVHRIFESDIVSLDRYHSYNPQSPVEYNTFRAITPINAATGLSGTITSRPWRGVVDTELPYISDNATAWRTRIVNAIGPWYTRLSEVAYLTLCGWRFAHLCAGSYVEIYHRRLVPRSRRKGVRWLVLSVQTDWFGATTSIVVAHVPERADDT